MNNTPPLHRMSDSHTVLTDEGFQWSVPDTGEHRGLYAQMRDQAVSAHSIGAISLSELSTIFQDAFSQEREQRRVHVMTGVAGWETFQEAIMRESLSQDDGAHWRSARMRTELMTEEEMFEKYGFNTPVTDSITITEHTSIPKLMEELYGSRIQGTQGHNHSGGD